MQKVKIIKINIINKDIVGDNATNIINTLRKEKIEFKYFKSDIYHYSNWKSIYFDIKQNEVTFKIRISNHSAKADTIFSKNDVIIKRLSVDEIIRKIKELSK